MTKILAALLAALMLVSVVACGNNSNDPVTTTSSSGEVTGDNTSKVDDNRDANGYLKDDLPDNLNYGNKVSVLYWQDVEEPEFEAEGQTGDIVNDAIWQRNTNVQERLGITFEWTAQDGDNGERAAFVKFVENAYNAGESYDIIATYSRTSGMLACRGFLYNLNDIEDNYINLEQPWWPSTITESVTIGDAVYFLSGDASTNVLHFMYVMWYNKQLITDLNLENPVQLVRDNKWTLDKFYEMTANTYQDLNNNGNKDVTDFYGFCGVNYGLDAFYTGSGLRLIEVSDTDMLKVSDDYYSEKTVGLIDALGRRCTSNDWYIGGDYQDAFVDGRVVFCQNRAYFAQRKLLDSDVSYGLVPTPKYDENQADYVSVLGNPITLYSIMNNAPESKLSELTAVLECWASEGYRNTTPALFETNMQLKYSETSDEADMFTIIHDTINFDLGRIFSNEMQYMSEIPSKTAEAGASWTSRYKTYQKILASSLKSLVAKFEKIQES